MIKKRWWILAVLVLVLLSIGLFIFYKGFHTTSDFSKTSLIRMNIPLGGDINATVKITNPFKTAETFKVSLNNFKDLASLSENDFVLDSRESINIFIQFKDLKKEPGVYVGKLLIESSSEKEEIPIIVGVEDPNSAFAVIPNSIPKYDSVYPGGKLGIDFRTFDLVGANVQTVKSDYIIKNLEDEVVLTGNTNLIVGTGSKSEIIDIPEDWSAGDYVFILYIDYKETTSFSSYLFSVLPSDRNSFLGNFENFLILIAIFVVLVIVLVIYFIQSRDSLLIELKKQQNEELRRNSRYVKNSKKLVLGSKEKPGKKKIKIIRLQHAGKNIIKKLKEKQKKQREEILKLRRSNTRKELLKKRIESWKEEGYKMPEADKEVKKAVKKGVKDQIKEWNKQGYDTSFLK